MQRTDGAGRREHRVEPLGILQRTPIDGLHGVERRADFVVRLDALEVLLDERAAGDALRRECRPHLVYRGLEEMKRRRLRPHAREPHREREREDAALHRL